MSERQEPGNQQTKLQPFSCSECGANFTRNENLKRHMKIHSNSTRIRCKYCPKSFLREDLCARHVKTRHEGRVENNSAGNGLVSKVSKRRKSVSKVAEQHDSPNLIAAIQSLDPSKAIPPLLPFQSIPEMENGHQFKEIVLPPFDSEDLKKSYDPRLHHYFTLRPFYPPEYFEHYVEVFFDDFHATIPLLKRDNFDCFAVPASFLRALASIGCFSTCLVKDNLLGKEIWNSGLSVLQLYLRDNKERANSLWVCQALALFITSGLFAGDAAMLERVGVHVIDMVHTVREKKWISLAVVKDDIEIEKGSLEWESKRRVVFSLYFIGIMSSIFNAGPTFLSKNELQTILPLPFDKLVELDNGQNGFMNNFVTLDYCIGKLETCQAVLNETPMTSLILVCAIHETISDMCRVRCSLSVNLDLQVAKLHTVLENLKISVMGSMDGSAQFDHFLESEYWPRRDLDLFWCLWYLAYVRLQCQCASTIRMYSMGQAGIREPLSVLASIRSKYKGHSFECGVKCLEDIRNISSITSWLRWKLGALSLKDLPMSRFALLHILTIIEHKALVYERCSTIWSGSEITYIETYKDFWNRLLEGIGYEAKPTISGAIDGIIVSVLRSNGAWNTREGQEF